MWMRGTSKKVNNRTSRKTWTGEKEQWEMSRTKLVLVCCVSLRLSFLFLLCFFTILQQQQTYFKHFSACAAVALLELISHNVLQQRGAQVSAVRNGKYFGYVQWWDLITRRGNMLSVCVCSVTHWSTWTSDPAENTTNERSRERMQSR